MVSKSRRVVAAAAAVADMSFALSGLSKDGFTFRVSCCFFFFQGFLALLCVIIGASYQEKIRSSLYVTLVSPRIPFQFHAGCL